MSEISRRSTLKGLFSALLAPRPMVTAVVEAVTPTPLASVAIITDAASPSLSATMEYFHKLASSANKLAAMTVTPDKAFFHQLNGFSNPFNQREYAESARPRLEEMLMEKYNKSVDVLSEYRDNLHRVFDSDLSALDDAQKESARLFRLRKALTKEHAADFAASKDHIPEHHRTLVAEVERQLGAMAQKLRFSSVHGMEEFVKGYKELCESEPYSHREKHHDQLVDRLVAEAVDNHVYNLFKDKDYGWGTPEIRRQFNDALRLSVEVKPSEITDEILYENKSWPDEVNLLRGVGNNLQQKLHETRAHTTIFSTLFKELNLPLNAEDLALARVRVPYIKPPYEEAAHHFDHYVHGKERNQPEILLQLVTNLEKLGDRVSPHMLEYLRRTYDVPPKAKLFAYLAKHHCKMPEARKQWITEQISRQFENMEGEVAAPMHEAERAKPVHGVHTQRLTEEYRQHAGADEPGAAGRISRKAGRGLTTRQD